MTPHLLVNADHANCMVPAGHINDGKIVLNIAPMAVQGLTLGDEEVSFSARFSGQAESIMVPVLAILAVYARENGQGMMFSDDDGAVSSEDDLEPDQGPVLGQQKAQASPVCAWSNNSSLALIC